MKPVASLPFGLLVTFLPAAAAPPISVADALRTTAIIAETDVVDPDHPSPVSISPNRRLYAVRLATGDIERNGVRLDVLAGSLDSLDAAARPVRVASLFSHAWGSESSANHPALNSLSKPIWLDDATIAFPWEDSNDVIQFVAVDLNSRRTRWLTRHPADVLLASASRSGSVFYAAQRSRPEASAARIASGFTVGEGDAIGTLRGQSASTLDLYYDLDTFLAHGDAAPRKLDLRLRWSVAFQPVLSPDGRFVLVNAWPETLPESWRGHYRPDAAPAGLDLIAEAFKDRDSWYGRQITQLFVVDMASGAVRPLWNAPTRSATRLHASWSPDGERVAVGATFGPEPLADPASALGSAIAVIERASGRYHLLRLPDGVDPLKLTGLAFTAANALSVEIAGRTFRFVRSGDAWRPSDRIEATSRASPAPVRVVLREGPDTPPRLIASEAESGRERLVIDPNPGLASRFALGRVEAIRFSDREGRQWSGLLYHPVGERAGQRYPLVIQAHSHAPAERFSLYGLGLGAPGTGPSWSVYAAQPLAGRGIAVLQLEDKRMAGISLTPREPDMYMRAYEAGVDFLAAKGLVDPDRVGLSGFSRSGWHIEYALTHSERNFAAAITSDNLTGSYVEDSLNPGNLDRENGGPPFGAGLAGWLATAPGFSAERIRTPLRAQVESGGLPAILFRWELFARLRRLGAPVELAVVPHVDRGSHNLLNPSQLLSVKEGAVDWFDFWLNGREDADPAKADQYGRWRALRAKRDALAKVPRPPLLEWEARPHPNVEALRPVEE